ncbi:mechanosensitive ion channel family protein [Lichenibacterium dinghuense]|uniref:mechanosensitive ion channel family protein n=1 Tax=Lichenibacterium dinghuense TaxID=2895977 RepID=UPI001F196536|nr:mechanosensitive ion channel family protein [Lichenibacterium sp. 6Y81]
MRIRLPTLAAAALLAGGIAASAAPAAPAPAAPAAAEQPVAADKLRLLLDLLGDPQVRAAIDARRPEVEAAAPAAGASDTMAGGLGGGLKRLRDHVIDLASAVPRLPAEVDHARVLLTDMLGRGDALSLALFVPLFVALGFGGEGLFRLNTRRFGRWLLALPLDTARERVSAVFARLAFGLGLVGSFALGSVGAMLPFDFTARFKQVLLALLLAAVATRLAAVAGRFLLAPGAPRFRLVPIETDAAAFLFRRTLAAGLLLGVGLQQGALLAALGFDAVTRELCLDVLETLALALALATVARYPRPAHPELVPEADPPLPHAEWRRLHAGWARVGLGAAAVLLWCFALAEADRAFWLLLFAVAGPAAVRIAQRSIRHVMRRAGPVEGGAHRLEVVLLERGVRTLMIVGAAALLAHLIGLDVATLAMHDTVPDRITRGIIGVIVVVLVADFLWHVIVALIDRKLAGTLDLGPDGGAHAARLQTLLPITRNLSLAALVVIAGTMVLASLGVEIGPLIASAGVVGVAIGFGAQTLVKDIISGIFYLVDDAFRVGEYIQSGTYKGTVESFSLRSVKLRHQRGALYTIPFGTLGAVQNLSRDWVVDKIPINVPYDTDIDAVRRIMKRIGAELLEDEELAPGIIATLKLQGVAQFGDYAIKLQTKMTTVPGDVQFAARRRALLLIQREFRAQGIGFALPTVQVSGDASDAAAAQNALSLVRPAEAAAAE